MILLIAPTLAQAHVGNHPSVHDTVAGVVERLQQTLPTDELKSISVEKVYAFLTEEERHVLGSEHVTFRVNVPVTLYVFRKADMGETVFWLADRGFEKTDLLAKTDGGDFEGWKKAFPAGEIGLGVNSLSGDGDHYFAVMEPQSAGDVIEINQIYPGQYTAGTFNVDERIYVSWNETILTEVPEALAGQTLFRGNENKRRSAKLTNVYQTTDFPATETPDQVVLTWTGDPKTTQTVQWRTSTAVTNAALRYRAKKLPGSEAAERWITVAANTSQLISHNTINDPIINRQVVNLIGLDPGTVYEYEVGDGSRIGWTAPAEFSTAPISRMRPSPMRPFTSWPVI